MEVQVLVFNELLVTGTRPIWETTIFYWEFEVRIFPFY